MTVMWHVALTPKHSAVIKAFPVEEPFPMEMVPFCVSTISRVVPSSSTFQEIGLEERGFPN